MDFDSDGNNIKENDSRYYKQKTKSVPLPLVERILTFIIQPSYRDLFIF